jgi:ribosome-interacting GTPase 1
MVVEVYGEPMISANVQYKKGTSHKLLKIQRKLGSLMRIELVSLE